MNFSGYPKVANIDFSPPQNMLSYPDQYDQAYLGDAYSSNPDYSINNFLDTDSFFDRPLTSVEMSQSFPPKSQTAFNPTLPATGISASNSNPAFRPTFNPAPFGQLEQYPAGFSLNPSSLNSSNEPGPFSPNTQISSRTPSLCGDAPQQTISPSLSPRIVKRESPSSPTSQSSESTPKRPQRKRGRPRLDRSNTDTHSPISGSSAKCPRSGRLPHNQVERKYREGLNSELERLRRAVPTLPQSDEGGVMGQPKPSKAMVLSSAIEYIRRIEKERDALREENERLRFSQAGGSGEKAWRMGDDTLEEFLMDP
ncbi:hypothetical protein IQ07DRAFT_593958 [Pyrenochaeta sp. DS3sAY3a]|nr:hypothetical protein IQ07DRAFT_593958 [Pyrenochaeta sp. DS3sAY3a]